MHNTTKKCGGGLGASKEKRNAMKRRNLQSIINARKTKPVRHKNSYNFPHTVQTTAPPIKRIKPTKSAGKGWKGGNKSRKCNKYKMSKKHNKHNRR